MLLHKKWLPLNLARMVMHVYAITPLQADGGHYRALTMPL